MQAKATITTNKLVPPDALSYSSEGYVNDDEDIADIRRNKRRSFAPSETSESYMDMNGRPLDMDMNSAYNVANSVEAPRENPPGFEYVVSSNQYEEILERGYTRLPVVAMGPPPIPTRPHGPSHKEVVVEEKKAVPQAKILCGFWQGRTEIGLRTTILILELLMLAVLIAAFVNWSVVVTQPPPSQTLSSTITLSGVSFGTGFIAIPMFFFLIIVTLEEIIFLLLRLCQKTRNSCTNCLLIWDIVNSTLVGILFFLSTVGSAGLCSIWTVSVPYTSDAIRGEVALFILATTFFFLAGILCIVKTVWIPVLTYKRRASSSVH